MNISVSELLVILLIGLLVIKPNQLPEVAYALGRLMQAVQRQIAKIKKEMDVFVQSGRDSSEQKREP